MRALCKPLHTDAWSSADVFTAVQQSTELGSEQQVLSASSSDHTRWPVSNAWHKIKQMMQAPGKQIMGRE